MNDRYRTDLFVQHLYKDQPGKLRFDPEKIRTREDFESWKEQVREKAYELMQFPEDAYEEAKVHFLYSRQRDGYRVEKYCPSSLSILAIKEGSASRIVTFVPSACQIPANSTPITPPPMISREENGS